MHVLIIEDNRDLATNLVEYLEACGHTVDTAMDGATGLSLALSGEFDVIVLDLGLPSMDGMQVCRRLREAGRATPLVMLTGRAALESRIEGLDLGADDYLIKPVALKELEARLRAQARRAAGGPQEGLLRIADLELNERTMHVTRAGDAIVLARLEYELLRLLMRAAPAVMSRVRLERELWGDEPPRTDTLRNHVHVLRRAIDRPYSRPLLHTVHGVGYRLADTE